MRQLIKFCVVGATSTVVDKGILWLLLTFTPWMPWWLSQSFSFCFGVTNGFIWNRLWTFKGQNQDGGAAQYSKFVISNIIGLILNLAITKAFLIYFTGQYAHVGQNPPTSTTIMASLCAIPIVVIWNFSAARWWTFKANHAPNPTMTSAPLASPRD